VNVCSHSVENLSSCFLLKILKFTICRTVVLHVILYGCETLSPIPREEHRLRAFEGRMRRRVFGLNREEMVEG